MSLSDSPLLRKLDVPLLDLHVMLWHPQVEAANAEVEEGNQARQGMSASMLERLKKASGDYDVRACIPGPQHVSYSYLRGP